MKHTLKQMVAILLTAAMLITLLPWLSQRSSAQDTSGSWGDHLTYHFYEETGLLEFSGSGDMYNSASPDASPWYVFRERITAITFPEGMTGIGANTFNDCTALTGITVPESVTYIEGYAFSGCTSLYDMTVQNAACDIYSTSNTLGVPGTTVIHGYAGSTAQEYAYCYGYAFVSLGGDTPPAPEPIPIDGEHFPDESFREYVRGFDSDKDGYLNYAERTGVADISCTEYGIASLEGIEYFPALTDLYCGGNQLTALDVSENPALTNLSCDGNQLTALDVSGNMALTNLSCGGNQLTELDVSGNTALTNLSCYGNQLTALDLSGNAELTNLSCEYNQLTTLSVSNNTALTWLSCGGNQLTELDVSKNTALTEFSCEYNQLTALDVSQNTALTGFYCVGNQLIGLDISNNTALLSLHCYSNQITDLDISNNTFLEDVLLTGELIDSGYHSFSKSDDYNWYCLEFDYMTTLLLSDGSSYYENPYETMSGVPIDTEHFPDESFRAFVREYDTDGDGFLNDEELSAVTEMDCSWHGRTSIEGVEYFTALTELDCSWNNLESLDVSKNTALTTLYCGRNQLTALDVSGNTALTNLSCGGNQLSALDVSGNTALTNLSCGGNQLTALDVSGNTALTNLSCGDNQLATLDVSGNTALTELSCNGNQLTTLDVSRNTALMFLDCNNNSLTVLNASGCTGLMKLYCQENQLTELNVSGSTGLRELYCYGNQLTELNVSNNTALTRLYCNSNQLTELNVSRNTALIVLDCYSNQLTSLDVSANTALQVLYSHNNHIKDLDISTNPILSNAVLNGTKDPSMTDFNYFYSENGFVTFDYLTTVLLPDGEIYTTPVSEIFSDVRDNAYYADPVLWAVQNGITSGTGEGQFSPQKTCTREQIVTFLYCAAGKPAYTITENPFTDVHEGKWYYDAVMWAYENGITTGVGTSTFGKGQGCTRAQAVTFLWKSLGAPEPETEENPFEDVAPGKYYYKAVLWALENGITSGTSPTTFGIGDTCTRAQIVTFLYKAYGNR